MKRLFRWLFRLLILAIVLAVALVLSKDTLLKSFAEWRIRRETGLSVTINKFEVGLLAPTFTMQGFKLYNPPEFGGSVLLDVPEVHFEYDPQAAATGKLHLKLLRFHLKELNLVRNHAGQTNVAVVLARSHRRSGGPSPPFEFGGLDRLYLTMGTVRYTDMAEPRRSWERVIGWKDYEVKNLRTAEDVKNWALLVVLQIEMQERFRQSSSNVPR